MGAVIDAKSGRVAWLPFTVCCGDYRQTAPIEFRLDSSLLVIRGERDERESGTYFYTFEAGKFKEVAAAGSASTSSPKARFHASRPPSKGMALT